MKVERFWYFTHIQVGKIEIFAPCTDKDEREKGRDSTEFEYHIHIGGDGYVAIMSNVSLVRMEQDTLNRLGTAAVDYIEQRLGDPKKSVYYEDITRK